MSDHQPIPASQLNSMSAPCPDNQCRLPDGGCAEQDYRLCRQNNDGIWTWHKCVAGTWADTGELCSSAWEGQESKSGK